MARIGMRTTLLAPALLLVGLSLGAMLPTVLAQPTPAATTPATSNEAAPSETAAQVDVGDITRLVAPVALYPDPLLALILQASVQPVQVVQAERFLVKHAQNPTLAPDPAWDPSILGLLNYPPLIGTMNEYLDWTETMGNAVVDRLPAVQDAVQRIRWSAYQAGILGSSELQQVVIQKEIIRIMPANADKIVVPTYDPEALLTAIATTAGTPVATEAPGSGKAIGEAGQAETASAPAEPSAAAGQPGTTAAAPPAAAATPTPAEAAPAPSPATPAPVADHTVSEPTYAAPPATAAYAAPAPAPAYVAPAPAYAGTPVVSYAEPQSTFWSSAATFTGGAVVGGLLGYAIGDDWFDDDNIDVDWDDLDIDEGDLDELRGRRGGINIEDSTIVTGGRGNRSQVQAELRARREGTRVAARPSTRVEVPMAGASTRQATRTGARATQASARPQQVTAVRENGARAVPGTRQVALPNSGRAGGTNVAATGAAARTPGTRPAAARQQAIGTRSGTARAAATPAGLATDIGQGRTARAEAQRGAASRAQAQSRANALPQRQATSRPTQPRAATAPTRPAPRTAAPVRPGAAAPAAQTSRSVAPSRPNSGGLASGFAGGDKVRLQADRGRASRGGALGGGGRAGGGRRG
ncbi:DUF3300 domain-containing protein [Benzoatithermus flavus]|uniref:DUF3300 domain-containing protein n=1 Tax=Benzoatithermus flavus TaxID=3108223 RepID=A0ABU8XTM6_9PROT